MFYLELVAAGLVSIGFLFIILCVNPDDSGILSKICRFFIYTLPDYIYLAILKVLGQERLNKIRYYATYIFYKPTPVFQVAYLILSVGGYGIFFIYGFNYIPNPFVPSMHMYVGSFLYLIALGTFFMASINPPGKITKDNVKKFIEQYPYDQVLYTAKDCSICKIQKPARAKHCKVCGYCVAKIDHHCIWINQCVGYNNYKYFLAFILSHSLICIYAGQVGYYIFKFISYKEKLWNAVFVDGQGNRIKTGTFTVFQVLLKRYSLLMFIVILCLVIGFTLAGFLIYHIYLLRKNVTSEESIKIAKVECKGGKPNPEFYNKGFRQNLSDVIEAEC